MNDLERQIWTAVLALRWVLCKDMRRAIADANEALLYFEDAIKDGASIPVRPEDLGAGYPQTYPQESGSKDDQAESI